MALTSLAPREALTTTGDSLLSACADVDIVNAVDVWPAETTTDIGTIADLVGEADNDTQAPPAGAGQLRVTTPCA